MDEFQDYLTALLPAPLHHLTHLSIPTRLYLALSTSFSTARSLSSTYIPRLAALDAPSLALLVLALLAALFVLDMLRRAILSWLAMLVRLSFYAAAALLVWWGWSRGIDGVITDIEVLGALWSREYRAWAERVEVERRARETGRTGWG